MTFEVVGGDVHARGRVTLVSGIRGGRGPLSLSPFSRAILGEHFRAAGVMAAGEAIGDVMHKLDLPNGLLVGYADIVDAHTGSESCCEGLSFEAGRRRHLTLGNFGPIVHRPEVIVPFAAPDQPRARITAAKFPATDVHPLPAATLADLYELNGHL
jgi:hypothetical protein